jgi:LysR substrate binding domain
MEIGSNETIKQAVMAGLGIAFISAHIDDGRLAILDVAGLPEIRQWFVVHPATKRMMPAARSLRDFLVAEGRRFLPNLKHGRRGGCGERQSLCQEEVMIIFVFRVKAWQGIRVPGAFSAACSLHWKRKVSLGIH